MRVPYLPLPILFLLFPVSLWAGGHFQLSPEVDRAFTLTLSLRLSEADQHLQRIRQRQPDNLMILYVENYRDILRLMISEDDQLYQQLKGEKMPRLRQIMRGDKDSPYYLFLQAEIRLHWAVTRLKFEEYLLAFNEISIAYELLEKCRKQHPDFLPARRSYGLLRGFLGTIPRQMRWAARLIGGLEGDVAEGLQELKAVWETVQHQGAPEYFVQETLTLYCLAQLYLAQQPVQALDLLKKQELSPASNPVHTFLLALVHMKNWQNDQAIAVLQKAPNTHAYLPLPYLDYLLGETHLRKLDPEADLYFERYLKAHPGPHYRKDAWVKRAYVAVLQNRPQTMVDSFLLRCQQSGAQLTDEDKRAHRLALGEDPFPTRPGLEVQLLFDGGYFDKALERVEQLVAEEEDPQWIYRKARILHEAGRWEDAIRQYQQCIDLLRHSPQYFACSSALQLGLIFEKRGIVSKAIPYFELCLDLNPDNYRQSLHQKAKAGLNRLKNR